MLTLTDSMTVTANFAQTATYKTLSITLPGNGSGMVTSSPAGITCSSTGGQCSASFLTGSSVILTVSPTTGSTFSGWSGGECSGAGPCTVILTDSTAVTATFAPIVTTNKTLSLVISGAGSGTVRSSPRGISCSRTADSLCNAAYPTGSMVLLVPLPDAGSSFTGWSGGECTGSASCTLALTANTTLTANFSQTAATYSTLSVALSGNGSGAVESTPEGINCGKLCSASVITGSQISLTAFAESGSQFSGWTGACAGQTTSTCTLTVNSAESATASFTLTSQSLSTLLVAVFGDGSVTSSPAGISCSSSTCSANFTMGSQVALSAQPANGWSFAGWSGTGCRGKVTPCNLSLGGTSSVAALFQQSALPSSRSIVVGTTATAFATIINADSVPAMACGLVPTVTVPATFNYQPTDPTTNGLIGTPNTPVDIPAGKSQSFIIAMTADAPFAPTDVTLSFACANENAAPVSPGLNTLLLSASATPVPDIIALVASLDPGYVDIPGATGTGAFAVATINLGNAASITVSADTGEANLPVTTTICQTNPSTGACLASPTPTVTTTIAASTTPTFAVFVAGTGTVANSPSDNRVFVRFTDAAGAVRGSTSVAVRTQ